MCHCCIAMNNYTLTYECRNITTQWRRASQFFRKIYLSICWKGCVWEGVGDRTELQHIEPHSYGHDSFSFPFSWLLSRGPGGPAPLEHGPHSSIFSPTETPQSVARGPPLLGVGSLYRVLSPTDLNFLSPGLLIIWRPLFFPWASQFRT